MSSRGTTIPGRGDSLNFDESHLDYGDDAEFQRENEEQQKEVGPKCVVLLLTRPAGSSRGGSSWMT